LKHDLHRGGVAAEERRPALTGWARIETINNIVIVYISAKPPGPHGLGED